MALKTYKFRLYPTRKQAEKLQWTLARCCELYNAALQERREMYTYTGKGTTYNQQAMQLPEIKGIREEYKDIHSQVLQDVLRKVENAFKGFFKRVKAGKKPGYPRFQGCNRYDSFCYPQAGFSLENGLLVLSKVGHVKIKQHRKVLGNMKTCTLKREGNCWYVCLVCEVQSVPRTPYTDECVGIDLGVSKLATLSTGDVIENPQHYRRAEKQLAKAGQALSRKKRGSKRRKKAVERMARLHRKVRNQRNDYLHQWSRRLVNTYETIVFEEIAPANLSKRAKPKQDEETGHYLPNGASAKSGLNKSILDTGWSTFIARCEYKAENAGTVQVVKVDPRMTSQVCSGCGTVVKKDLSERWHSCACGYELDRDHNAAINIKALWLGQSHQEAQAS
ncbi:transposase [Ktedonobacter sp. SOSP1-52]|uniref:RNA-guided endonuclease InsQ/TnpB family protein n=1 Tax=Ktedonobacter sp. SOSP1-52 TaxID=2778366 RepID=UPI0019153443|nr:RNA-guided endonuclease TnpB family protein [Ktedonobacter sp. SOSP1-52]GHO61224.1 transposase [Ktedonobacter sp. SOSP1-52]